MFNMPRRDFMRGVAAGALTGLADLSFLGRLPSVSADEAKADPKLVRLRPEIEPLVRLIEETPRDRLLEEVADRIRKGMSYREVLAALQLAGVRNVPPRPSVGFKFHAVLVVNSAHLASQSAPDAERWLPIFWALDTFKSSQAAAERENSGWRMAAVDESKVPPARKARAALVEALESWDEQAADAAMAGLVRTAGAQEVFELLCRFGARDFRAIGHKAIFVANSWRTLQCIGWQHAEPILRSLANAFVNHSGEENPAKRDAPADRPWRRNLVLAKKIPDSWCEGKPSNEATSELLATLRSGSDSEACEQVVALLTRGVAPQSIWDALFAGAGELLLRQPGIVALHAVTSTNALRYAFENTREDETRRLMMLQNAAFLPLFREAMKGRGKVGDQRVDQLEPAPMKASGAEAIGEIFAEVGKDRLSAARKTLGLLKEKSASTGLRPPLAGAKELLDAARLLVFLKGTDSHDYKFSSAAFEDYWHISPAWRDRFLATCTYQLRGASAADNKLVQRTRAALASQK